MNELNRTILGIDENIEAALSYFLGFLTGFLLLILEKENKFVKFHAIQSIAVFVPLFVIGMFLSVMSSISYVGWMFQILTMLLWTAELLLWIFLMFKAYNGERFKLPIAGDIAEKNSM